MWRFGVRTTPRANNSSGKMVVTKVLICGGLVVVVAYGLYACSCRLRHRFCTRVQASSAAGRSTPSPPLLERQVNNDPYLLLVGRTQCLIVMASFGNRVDEVVGFIILCLIVVCVNGLAY